MPVGKVERTPVSAEKDKKKPKEWEQTNFSSNMAEALSNAKVKKNSDNSKEAMKAFRDKKSTKTNNTSKKTTKGNQKSWWNNLLASGKADYNFEEKE